MPIELVIVTPEGEAFSGPVDQVVLPGAEGDFGVLPNHERALAPLKHGPVEIKTGKDSAWAAIEDGFADVTGERVVVLADSCVLASEIDKTAVEATKSAVEAELASLGTDEEHEAHRKRLAEKIFQCELQLDILER